MEPTSESSDPPEVYPNLKEFKKRSPVKVKTIRPEGSYDSFPSARYFL